MTASRITHVVTVSCTGCFAPGPDFRIVRDLGLAGTDRALPPRIHRVRGRLPGAARGRADLRRAARRRRARRLHRAVQPAHPAQQLTRPDRRRHRSSPTGRRPPSSPPTRRPRPASTSSASARLSRARAKRTWRGRSATTASRWCSPARCRASSAARSAAPSTGSSPVRCRPHGRSTPAGAASWIVCRPAWSSPPTRSTASRAVLRDYGNMSSATVMFILREMLHDDAIASGATIAGLAFGPGLTVESALLTKRTAPSSRHPTAIDTWQSRGEPRRTRRRPARTHGRPRNATPTLLRATLRRFDTINRLVSAAGAPSTALASVPSWRRSIGRRACSTSAAAAATSSPGSPRGPSATASTWSGSASTPIRGRSRWRSPRPRRRGRDSAAPTARPARGGRALRPRAVQPRAAPPRPRPSSANSPSESRALSRGIVLHSDIERGRLAYAAVRDRDHAVRARDVPAHRRTALHPPQLPRGRARRQPSARRGASSDPRRSGCSRSAPGTAGA